MALLPGLIACSGACRGESPPGPEAAVIAGDADPGEAPAEAEPPDARALWFTSELGRQAILARERRDHDRAVELLDRMLAQSDLSTGDRAAAQWLRGLEDLRLERYAAAADRFAEARQAPELAAVELRLRWREAQARLDAGDPDRALALVESVPPAALADSPLRDDYIVVEADARNRTGDEDGAIRAYERYAAAFPAGKRRFEVKAKLARLLAADERDEVAGKALPLLEELLMESPLSDYGEEAARTEPVLRARLGRRRDRAESRRWEQELALARIDAALDRRRYTDAVQGANEVLRDAKLAPAQRCRALYVKGTALFKQRQRAKSRPVFEQATKACQSAGKPVVDLEVKSRYQGARGLYAEGKHAKAAKAFTDLATEHPRHSYADDAWVLAGESWLEQGDRQREGEAYRRALEIDGDMADEARRRLLLLTFDQGDAAGVVKLCDQALAGSISHPNVRAKLHYFRGRAHQRIAKPDEARADWVEAVRAEPLGYPALQAMARLREAGPDAFDEGLAVLGKATAERKADLTAGLESRGPGAKRALILARLGLGEAASDELAAAEVEGWPAVAVLEQAGLYAEGQLLLANMGHKWRSDPPGDANLAQWMLAHPRPFSDIVAANENELGVPHLLAYAVMQTESRFDPGVTSIAGARGLIQLMPATAKGVAEQLGVDFRPEQLFDPSTNLRIGMRYLADLVGRFGGGDPAVALAVPSYNAGAGAVDRWLTERGHWDLDLFIESIPYDETRHYTQSVLGRWWAYRWIYGPDAPDERVPTLGLQIPGGRKE